MARRDPTIELVSVDSMQVYRRMDVGTAKPSADEQRRVRHHLIDLVEPSDEFTVAEFQRTFRATLADLVFERVAGQRPPDKILPWHGGEANDGCEGGQESRRQ